MNYIDRKLFEMFTEKTGTHLLDSGGDNDRHWQRNQGRDLDSFINEPQAVLKIEKNCWGFSTEWEVSAFHICREGLDFDSLCKRFNSMPIPDWHGEYYGVSAMGQEWLDAKGFEFVRDFNTYNGDWAGSQTLQGTELEIGLQRYVLLQVHGGADVRGGYTDARLFTYDHYREGLFDSCGFSIEKPSVKCAETPDIFTGKKQEPEFWSLYCLGGEILLDGSYSPDDGDLEAMFNATQGLPVFGDIH